MACVRVACVPAARPWPPLPAPGAVFPDRWQPGSGRPNRARRPGPVLRPLVRQRLAPGQELAPEQAQEPVASPLRQLPLAPLLPLFPRRLALVQLRQLARQLAPARQQLRQLLRQQLPLAPGLPVRPLLFRQSCTRLLARVPPRLAQLALQQLLLPLALPARSLRLVPVLVRRRLAPLLQPLAPQLQVRPQQLPRLPSLPPPWPLPPRPRSRHRLAAPAWQSLPPGRRW